MAPKEDTNKENPQPVAKSSLGIKYPTLRDHPLHTPELWLKGKRADDGAEGLWRIHDELYDLSDFIDIHPGGKDWLILTKGTDITEVFESFHIRDKARNLVAKYFVRKATQPRNSPFTFKEDGFYRKLRKDIAEALKDIPEGPANRTKRLTDLLLVLFLSFTLVGQYFQNYLLGVMAGVTLSMLANAAHNFFHMRDNFRMYYFDLCLMSSRGWRVSHALSHHIYTNSVNDMEISSIEPFLNHLPHKKHRLLKYFQWVVSPFFYSFLFVGYFVRMHIQNIIDKKNIRPENLLPGLLFVMMFIVSKYSILNTILMFLCVYMTGGFWFGFVGVNAAHHHPEIFHDGDAPRKDKDWGLFQLDAVMDRTDITGSHFLVLTNYGDHGLHHLFPTIDHGKLAYLYPVFHKTCQEFGVHLRFTTQYSLIIGQYEQLVRVKPNEKAPGSF